MQEEQEIHNLKIEFIKIRKAGKKIIFPQHIRTRTLALCEQGYSISILCEKLNLSPSQIYKWKEKNKVTQNKIQNNNQDENKSKCENKKQPYDIKTIPIVPSVVPHTDQSPHSFTQNNKKTKKVSPRIFLKFFSLKILWR